MWFGHKSRAKRKRKFKIISIIILTILLLLIIDYRLRPIVKSVTAKQGQVIFSNAANEAVIEEISKKDYYYSDLIKVEHGENGKVLAITTDTCKVNTLKSAVAIAVQRKLSEKKYNRIKIPIGTLTETELLNGKGPNVTLNIYLSGSVATELNSTFESAGINQTKHQLMLVFRANFYAVLPGYPNHTTSDTNVIVAETIIVGDVPNFFANVG